MSFIDVDASLAQEADLWKVDDCMRCEQTLREAFLVIESSAVPEHLRSSYEAFRNNVQFRMENITVDGLPPMAISIPEVDPTHYAALCLVTETDIRCVLDALRASVTREVRMLAVHGSQGNRDTFHAFRMFRVGSSGVLNFLGHAESMAPQHVQFASCLHPADRSYWKGIQHILDYGHQHEPIARDALIAHLEAQKDVDAVQCWEEGTLFWDEDPLCVASSDGVVAVKYADGTDDVFLAEFKCPYKALYTSINQKPSYFVQVQMAMGIYRERLQKHWLPHLNLREDWQLRCAFVVYRPNQELCLEYVPFDENVFNEYVAAIRQVYVNQFIHHVVWKLRGLLSSPCIYPSLPLPGILERLENENGSAAISTDELDNLFSEWMHESETIMTRSAINTYDVSEDFLQFCAPSCE